MIVGALDIIAMVNYASFDILLLRQSLPELKEETEEMHEEVVTEARKRPKEICH